MKNIGVFVSENFQFLEVKFSMHLNRSVFVMHRLTAVDRDIITAHISPGGQVWIKGICAGEIILEYTITA